MGKSAAQRQREREAAATTDTSAEGVQAEGSTTGTSSPAEGEEQQEPQSGSAARLAPEGLGGLSQAEELAGVAPPVRTVDEAREAVRKHQPDAVPVVEMTPEQRAALPAQFVSSGTAGPATHAPVGTPTSQLFPQLQRFGDGSARGETQPGIPPPGEAERFAHQDDLDRIVEPQAKEGEGKAFSATHENGVITVRHDDGKIIRINTANVETIEDDGNNVKITLASGKEYDFSGEDAGVVRAALPR